MRPGRPRWRRHGLIRPTAAGIVMLALTAVLWYMALLLDDRALVAAALMAVIVWAVSLAFAVMQWIVIRRVEIGVPRQGDRDATVFAAFPGASSWVRRLLPRRARVRCQFARIDQDGRIIGRHVGLPPERRGLYRLESLLVRWWEPFGLFAVTRVLPRSQEMPVLPETAGTFSGRRQTPDPARGLDHSDDTGGVRSYMPGDSPRMISWKATAHRGELMTRETGRDKRTPVVVVLDARSPQGAVQAIAEPQIDAEVAQVLPLLSRQDVGYRLVVTDGVQVADDPVRIRRLLAAASPIAQDDMRSLAAHIAELIAGRHDVSGVRLITPYPDGALAVALAEAVGRERLRIVAVGGTAAGEAADAAADPPSQSDGPTQPAGVPIPARDPAAATPAMPATPATSATSSASSSELTGLSDLALAATAEPAIRALRRTSAAGCIIAACSMLVWFALSLGALTGLIEGTGHWIWFLSIALAVVAVESSIPDSGGPWYVIRMVGVIVADFVAAAVIAVFRVHDVTGVWLSDMPGMSGSSTDMPVVENIVNMVGGLNGLTSKQAMQSPQMLDRALELLDSGSPWRLFATVFTAGFDSLDRQLPPIDVDLSGDLVLVAAAAVIVAVIRCILAAYRVVPAFVLLPVALFAADYALVGAWPDWWRIALALLLFPISLWAVRPYRAFPLLPVVSGAVVTALALGLTPSALDFAYGVPLSIGDSTGLLSANTINPIVDLKRSLDSGSTATVLTYQADGRIYLRLATLDDFDGDTWSFDEPIAKDGGFYGSGIQLGLDGSNMMDDRQRAAYMQSPLGTYLSVFSEWDEDGDEDSGSGSGLVVRSDDTKDYIQSANVSIESLQSRFLPVPGTVNRVWGIDGDWLSTGSMVYSRSTSTSSGLEYSAYGIGVEPISSDAEFSRLDGISELRKRVEEAAGVGDQPWNERTAVRQAAVEAGLGADCGGWLLMPLTESDGSLLDAAGDEIGAVVPQGLDSGDAGSRLLNGIVLSDEFKQRFGISDQEIVLTMYSEETGLSLAMMITDLGSDETAMSESVRELYSSGNYAMVSRVGGGAWVPRDEARTALDQVDRMNRDAGAYRSLPDDLPDAVTDLVAQAKQDGVSGSDDDADEQIKAMRWLVDYFTDARNGFVYSLDAPDGNGRNNLQVVGDFLDTKSGYCTHYASTLAVLGRALGVPTRMVLGYSRGSGAVNGFGKYEVSADQLHAWTEAYIDDIGWVPFDVTPAASTHDATVAGAAGSDNATDVPDGVTTDDGDADDDTADTTDDADQNDADQTGQEDQSQADTDTAADSPVGTASVLPGWVRTACWTGLAVAVVVALLLIPWGIRARRRRRRFRIIAAAGTGSGASGGDDGPDEAALRADRRKRAWRAAWAELCDSAWDAGVRWRDADTERVVAGRIADRLDSGMIGSGEIQGAERDTVTLTAEHVCEIAFGGVDPQGVPDSRRIEAVCAALRERCCQGRPVAGIVGLLFPASVVAMRGRRRRRQDVSGSSRQRIGVS